MQIFLKSKLEKKELKAPIESGDTFSARDFTWTDFRKIISSL